MSTLVRESPTLADCQKLEAIADNLLSLIVRGRHDLIAPYFLVLDASPDVQSRLMSYRLAAICNVRGASDGFVKHVESLPDMTARARAYNEAATSAPSGESFEQLAVAGLMTYAWALPNVAARVDAYHTAASCAPIGSELERQAAIAFIKHVELLPDSTARAEAYGLAVRCAPRVDGELARLARKKLDAEAKPSPHLANRSIEQIRRPLKAPTQG
jgi:hypothetical protein